LVSLIAPSLFHPWLHITHSPHDLAAYPPIVDGEFVATSIGTHTCQIHTYHKDNAIKPVSGSKSDPVQVVLRTATHNVLSAIDKGIGEILAFDSANLNYLSQQYAHHFLQIIGQQESRLPPKKKTTALFHIVWH
jgi:hypothetical protein